MLLEIALPKAKRTIDSQKLPVGEEFGALLREVSEHCVPLRVLEQLLFFYRWDARSSFEIADLLSRRISELGCVPDEERLRTYLSVAGIHVQHGKDPREIFERLKDTRDRRIDLLKGLFLVKSGEYEDAEFLFEKINYKHGLELVNLRKSHQIGSLSTSRDPRIRCYASSRAWRDVDLSSLAPDIPLSKDFLYRIQRSDTYENASNIDVRLTRLCSEIERGSVTLGKAREELRSLLGKKERRENAEIHYLIGKTYHLSNDKQQASECYGKALTLDQGYEPARWNLARIRGTSDSVSGSYEAVKDYRAINALKNTKDQLAFVTDGCSKKIRQAVYLAKCLAGSDKKELPMLASLIARDEDGCDQDLLFDREVLYNNTAILASSLDPTFARRTLEKALSFCDPKYSDLLMYNRCIIERDLETLRLLPFPEATSHITLATSDIAGADEDLALYMRMRDERNGAKTLEVLKKAASDEDKSGEKRLFATLCLGSALIGRYLKTSESWLLDEALEYYKKFSTSFLAVNGIGVVYALKGELDAAVKVFTQITSEFPEALVNVAKRYLSLRDYSAAAAALMKFGEVRDWRSVDRALKKICDESSSSDLSEMYSNWKKSLETITEKRSRDTTVADCDDEKSVKRQRVGK